MKTLLMIVMCVALVSACKPPAANNTAAEGPVQVAEAEEKSKVTAADFDFMKEAAQAGLAEVKMGQLAVAYGESAQVKRLGERLVADHSKANRELEKLALKKQLTLPDDLGEQHKTMLQHLGSLRGSQFDEAFSTHVHQNHEGDVARFEKAASRAQDPQVRTFAKETLVVLRQHLELARELRGPPSISAAP